MIDLRSDTVTKPTQEMRQLMYEAVVGDDVYREDPTVNELEAYAAQLLGKESALFVTSGTQGNQVAVLTHTKPGQEVIMDQDAHVFLYEAAAIAALGGVQARILPHHLGQMQIPALTDAIRSEDIHYPETGLIWLENSHNRSGGSILPLSYIKEVYEIAKSHHIPVHMDGARIFNAAVASGASVKEIASYADTIQFCLSKGLGSPIGSLLVGEKIFIEKARKKRKMLGGGLRQAGVIAAPGLHALKTGIHRLAEDHEHAKMLAAAIEQHTDLTIANNVETNIILADTKQSNKTADEWVSILKANGILASAFSKTIIRFVTHRDIKRTDIEHILMLLKGMKGRQKTYE